MSFSCHLTVACNSGSTPPTLHTHTPLAHHTYHFLYTIPTHVIHPRTITSNHHPPTTTTAFHGPVRTLCNPNIPSWGMDLRFTLDGQKFPPYAVWWMDVNSQIWGNISPQRLAKFLLVILMFFSFTQGRFCPAFSPKITFLFSKIFLRAKKNYF